jgi:hypothetical protein
MPAPLVRCKVLVLGFVIFGLMTVPGVAAVKSQVATEIREKIQMSDWQIGLKRPGDVSSLFAETLKDWSSLKSAKKWKALKAENKVFIVELEAIHRQYSAIKNPWLRSDLQSEQGLSPLILGLQFDLLRARELAIAQKPVDSEKIWINWLKFANDIANAEGGVVGLRTAVVLRSLVFDELEYEVKNLNLPLPNLKIELAAQSAVWPVKQIISNSLAQFQVQVMSEIRKVGAIDFVKKYYGIKSERLTDLIKAHDQAIDEATVLTETSHYSQYMIDLFLKNPYSPSSDAIAKVQRQKWVRLEGEIGSASFIIKNMSSNPQVQSAALGLSDIDSMPEKEWKKVRKYFLSTANPMGRLLVADYLFHLSQIWRDYDVSSFKTELSRSSWLLGMLAIHEYKSINRRQPASMEELVSTGLLDRVPVDYHSGKPMNYSKGAARLDLITVK